MGFWRRGLHECEEIVANDLCRLREILHPDKHRHDLSFSMAHAAVEPGCRTLRHHLEGAVEVYYILRGSARMDIDGAARDVGPGDTVVIPAGAVQHLVNTGPEPVEFLALVQPPWQAEMDVRDEEVSDVKAGRT